MMYATPDFYWGCINEVWFILQICSKSILNIVLGWTLEIRRKILSFITSEINCVLKNLKLKIIYHSAVNDVQLCSLWTFLLNRAFISVSLL